MRVFWPRHLDCAVCSAVQCSGVVQCLPSSLRVVTLDGFKVCQTVSLSLWPLWPSPPAPAPAKTNNKTGDKVPIFAANNPHWDWMWPTGCQESRLTFRLVTSHRSSSSTSTVAPGFSENSVIISAQLYCVILPPATTHIPFSQHKTLIILLVSSQQSTLLKYLAAQLTKYKSNQQKVKFTLKYLVWE